MNNLEFVEKLKDIANNYKTLYILGCFGAPLNGENKKRYTKNYSYNAEPERKKMIESASPDTFGFDCVCLIKSVLWGWCGDSSKSYGGAKYESNGVPDIAANTMFSKCLNPSADFSKIEIGAAVWKDGHIGVYIGNGLAVECTPSWKNCVQITAVKNIGTKAGYDSRTWTKHGKLPYITYEKADNTPKVKTYTVKQGDTLSKIAAVQLGDASRYPEIKVLNNLKTDIIKVGQVLKIPLCISESHFEKLGRAYEKALNDIKHLDSVKKLSDM